MRLQDCKGPYHSSHHILVHLLLYKTSLQINSFIYYQIHTYRKNIEVHPLSPFLVSVFKRVTSSVCLQQQQYHYQYCYLQHRNTFTFPFFGTSFKRVTNIQCSICSSIVILLLVCYLQLFDYCLYIMNISFNLLVSFCLSLYSCVRGSH